MDTDDARALTLINMLRRFCAEEKVGDAGKGYDCSKCGGGEGAVSLDLVFRIGLIQDCDAEAADQEARSGALLPA